MSLFKKQYVALKASLPFLKFGDPPPVSSEKFLDCCSSFLSKDRMRILTEFSLLPGRNPDKTEKDSVIARYTDFETSLRNTLCSLRGAKTGIDAAPYRRTDAAFESDAFYAANSAFALSDPLERENSLDKARWDRLEEMELRHSSDFDALCIYRAKLLILEKWRSRVPDGADANIDKAVSGVTNGSGGK